MKPKVLVVDDEKLILRLLENILSLSGFEVLTASNATEFRAQALGQVVDAMVIDVLLGQEDGTQLYEKLLLHGLDRNIPVIFLSAIAGDRPVTDPDREHHYALMGKPFDNSELVREIRKLMAARSKAA